MDHVCDQCGASVESGKPFCKHCNAPQIRVITVEPVPSLATEIESTSVLGPAPSLKAYLPSRIRWSEALPATASAGIVGVILMFASRGVASGLGMLVAGFLGVVLYRRRDPESNVTARMGARLGLVCGAWAFGICAVIAGIATAFAGSRPEFRAQVLEQITQYAARNPSPQAQQLIEYVKTPDGLTVLMMLGLIITGVAFLIFSSIGGAIGAALLKRKERG